MVVEVEKVGEVIEASTSVFTAEAYELHGSPAFGSLVKTPQEDGFIVGLIYDACTGSMDPGRRVLARGRDLATEADILRHHPQLTKLLRTQFSALVVGQSVRSQWRHHLPAQPAQVHRFVYRCEPSEVEAFTQRFDFLHLVLNNNVSATTDELAAACLRHAAEAHLDDVSFLVQAGKEVARLIPRDPTRLNAILQRLHP
jgi:hypothetical protein